MEFATQACADEFSRCLNDNPNYENSAKTWEGPLVLEFVAESARLQTDVRLWLDLWLGKCRSAKLLENGEEAQIDYTISAPESMWAALIVGDDPTRLLMSGKFKISDNTGKLMRFPLAAGFIIKYLERLLAEW
jgi:putative sterol carrier protein